MNTDVSQGHAPRYVKLAKPKDRIDTTSHYNPYGVKRAALSYKITDNLNKLAQSKRKPGANAFSVSSPSAKSAPGNTGKQVHHKLINSNEQSRYAQESKEKKFLLDTYARITAARNKRCSKRLHELAKPKNYVPRTDVYEDFNYFEPVKKFDGNSPRARVQMFERN